VPTEITTGPGGFIAAEFNGETFKFDCPRAHRDCRAVKYLIAQRALEESFKRRAWLNTVGIGEKHWKVTREGIRESKETICAFLDNLRGEVDAGRGIVLVGPRGTGKSGTLALIGLTAYRDKCNEKQARFTTTTFLMMQLCAKKEEAYWPGHLLLLDEFGAAYESDYAFALFEDYLNWRYERNLSTCVAANLTKEQLTKNPFYSRIVDRWRETNKMVVMAGNSMRQPHTEAELETQKAKLLAGGKGHD
jgi:DNA replication protein DnaC